MTQYRHRLPLLDSGPFLTDGGLETTLVFHEGIELPHFAAFDLLKEGRYDEAATALRDFHGRYPEHELAPNALYWLGEAHYVRRDYTSALAAFQGLLQQYPGTRKAPDALLKAGYCQLELKQTGAARTTLGRVVNEFPDSTAAAEARSRLERIAAQGG